MQPDPEPAVLVLVPVPEETAARKALGLFAQYRIMLRPYGMKNLFDEIYRMGTTDDEHRHCDLGAEPDVGGYVQARCGTVPRTLPALRPPGKRRALQRAAV